MTALIGLGGKLRSGKDAIADYLVEHHGFTKLGMSDPLHEAMMTLNPIIATIGEGDPFRYAELVEEVGYVDAKRDTEVRRLLQVFGTEVGRNLLGENVWVDFAARRIRELHAEGKPVVITGMRFPNELAMIHDLDGISVWVNRPETDGRSGVHASESSVRPADFDWQVDNIGTLDDLYRSADALAYMVADLKAAA